MLGRCNEMTTYYTDIVCKARNVDRTRFVVVCDDVADALFALEDGAGASFVTSPNDFTVTFGFAISARSKREAMAKAGAVARTALHASGGATPNWPTFDLVEESAKTQAELI